MGAEYMLVDFGLSKQLNPGEDGVTEVEGRSRSFSINVGTPEFFPPEMFSNNWAPSGHGFEIDVYTLGIAMYGLLVGNTPFAYDGLRVGFNSLGVTQKAQLMLRYSTW